MAKKTGLGKGLDALFKDTIKEEEEIKEGEKILTVPINEVEPNRKQPRKHFDEEALEELAESVKRYGLIQPIIVTKMDNYYEIIAGERRWRACKKAGLKEIQVIIRENDEKINQEIALIENIQREDLNPIEKAKRIIKDYYDREFEDDKSVDFSDMSNVGLAFSETENGEHEITVSANLEHFSIDIFVDDKLYERRKYSSIDDLIDQELYSLNFQELTSLDEDRISQMFEIQSSESIEKPSTSPIWDEYRDIKKIYKDDIILYQVGDFFEVMGDDAKIVADKFDLVLTGRDVGYKDRIAMCGFPVRSKDKYIKGINELGYSVVVSSLNNGERQQGLYLSDNISDDFDDIDTNEIRAELEKSGIVNGKVVDADKLNNSPFIKQVVSDTEKAQQSSISDIEPEPQEDKPLTVPQSKPKSRVQTFDLHPEIPISDRHDYNFAEKEIETVGKKERFRRNMAAINVLKEC